MFNYTTINLICDRVENVIWGPKKLKKNVNTEYAREE